MIQIKLLDMSIIFYGTDFHLSKWNGSWIVTIKPKYEF
jgi:hypothetical protein